MERARRWRRDRRPAREETKCLVSLVEPKAGDARLYWYARDQV